MSDSGSPLHSALLQARMSGQDSVQRKIEMDALRSRLGDQRTRDEKLREAVEGFETIFVQKLWSQMRNTIPKNGYLHSREQETWQSMFDEKFAAKMTEAGGIGLGDMLFEQLQGKLNSASKTTGNAAERPPLRALSAKDQIQTVQAAGKQTDINELYDPMPDEDTVSATAPAASPASPSSPALAVAGDDALPPRFTEDDAKTFTKLDALARKIEAEDAAARTAAAVQAKEAHGMGGPESSRPEALGMVNWPLPGRITSDFGWRNDPFTGKRAWHAGVDIAGDIGDPVASCWDGKVVFAGEKAGYGKLVVLEHPGGWRSYYGHTSKIDVEVGDEVTSGKKIAEVGNTGRSTGPHLHFELRQGELAWNPEQIRNRLMAGLDVGRQG